MGLLCATVGDFGIFVIEIDQEIVAATVSNDELESGVAPGDGVVATSLRSL